MKTYNLSMEEAGDSGTWREGEWVKREEALEEIAERDSFIEERNELISELREQIKDLEFELREARDYE